MQSTHSTHLHLPALLLEATQTELFPALGNTNLLSIGKLCDTGCTATFTQQAATIQKDGNIILQGKRATTEPKLWHIVLPNTSLESKASNTAALAVNQSSKPAGMVAFSHAALFSPPIKTLAEALRKDFIIGFPWLTKENLAKHPPQSIATIRGHLDQTRTKQKRFQQAPPQQEINISDPNRTDSEDMLPQSKTLNKQTHSCFAAVVQMTGQVYGDQAGRFLIPSSQGNNYSFVLYDYDSNFINAEPIRNREGKTILEAYKLCFNKLKTEG
jgi:hypothetical protein